MRCKTVSDRDSVRWFRVVGVLLAFVTAVEARETPDYRTQAAKECPQQAVDAHVREQFALYGPRSTDREYFGFVFVVDDAIHSAVVQGESCAHSNTCSVDTSKAVPLIPKGARVLGEWHTHPQSSGAGTLSPEDVRGARGNHHIHCYGAYYSQPDGKIYAWDPLQALVPTAMASLVLIGTYNRSARKSGDPMPFYEYQCPHCGYDEEVLQKINDKPLTKCPSCGKKGLKKLMSAPVFRLKGSGWYETDFKGDKENKRNLAGADKEEPKAESKSEPAKTEAAKVEAPKAEPAKPEKASKSASKPAAKRAKSKAKPARKARR